MQAILDKWQLFCERPPKGFEKYFKPGSGTKAAAGKSTSATEDGGKAAKSDAKSSEAPLSKPPGATADPLKPPKAQQSEWNFGMFSPSAKTGGSGRPLGGGSGGDGNGDRDKWLLLGAMGVAGLLGLIALMEVSYKEIGWKEFVNG